MFAQGLPHANPSLWSPIPNNLQDVLVLHRARWRVDFNRAPNCCARSPISGLRSRTLNGPPTDPRSPESRCWIMVLCAGVISSHVSGLKRSPTRVNLGAAADDAGVSVGVCACPIPTSPHTPPQTKAAHTPAARTKRILMVRGYHAESSNPSMERIRRWRAASSIRQLNSLVARS